MKICFLQTKSYPLFNPQAEGGHGGSELQLYLLATELAKDDQFKVSFVVGDYGQKSQEIRENVEIYKSFSPQRNDSIWLKVRQVIAYWKILKKVNADCYFSSTGNPLNYLVNRFCYFKKKKHFHRTAHENEVSGYHNKRGFSGRFVMYFIKHADLVFTQNKSHQKLLKNNYHKDSIVLKNGFYLRSNVVNSKMYILWVARFESWKRPELFLKLAQDFLNEKFIMIAPYAPGRKQAWLDFRKQASHLRNFELIEKVPFKEIQDYFDKAKLFLNTSESEGFPNTFIQAGLASTPIISLNVDPDNFIQDYDCGIFCNNQYLEMKNAISKILSYPEIWETKSRAVFNYVKKNHDIVENINILKKSLKIYKK